MFRLFTVSAVVTLFLLNCSNDNRIVAAGTDETSVASIKITMAQDSPFRRLADSAVITVSAGDMLTITQELTITDSSVEGSIKGIPVGKARFFSLTVYDSMGNTQYRGTAEADIFEGSTARIVMTVIRVSGDAEIITAHDITVSMDSLMINSGILSEEYMINFYSNAPVAISLDSAFIVIDSMDTTGSAGYVLHDSLAVTLREYMDSEVYPIIWDLRKCDSNRFRMVRRDSSTSRKQVLSFSAQEQHRRIDMMEFGGGLYSSGKLWYPSFLRGALVLHFSNDQIITLRLYSYEFGTTVSDADGNVYRTVRIGNQEWMAENLRTTKYNDGSPIPNIISDAAWDSCNSNETGAYCYYDNTTDSDSIEKYGALYNWYAVNTGRLAPEGWHVPTDSEWTVLENWLIANGYNYDGTTTGNKIAKSMAAKTDWVENIKDGAVGNDLSTNNKSGFSALPGGCRLEDGRFYYKSYKGMWWITPESVVADVRCLLNDFEFLGWEDSYNNLGVSVRLLRD